MGAGASQPPQKARQRRRPAAAARRPEQRAGCICVADPSVTCTLRPGAVPDTLLLRCARRSVPLISAWRLSAGGPLCRRRPWWRRRPVCGRMWSAGGSKDSTRTGQWPERLVRYLKGRSRPATCTPGSCLLLAGLRVAAGRGGPLAREEQRYLAAARRLRDSLSTPDTGPGVCCNGRQPSPHLSMRHALRAHLHPREGMCLLFWRRGCGWRRLAGITSTAQE